MNEEAYKGVKKGLLKISAILVALYIIYVLLGSLAPADYRAFPVLGSRNAVWIFAELHLLFAAFVLAIPIFAVTAEYIGYRNKDERFDRLAKEMTGLLTAAFTITALFGAALFVLAVKADYNTLGFRNRAGDERLN